MKNLIREYCLEEGDRLEMLEPDEDGYLHVLIYFVNDEDREDETEFDVEPESFNFATGECDDLISLWEVFCDENNFDVNSVTEIDIYGVK